MSAAGGVFALDLAGCDAGAVIDGPYRYRLWRIWDRSRHPLCFCMLNPSTADALKDDPTIRKCTAFAKAWRYGGIVVVNMFAWRATDPGAMHSAHKQGRDIVGPFNDANLRSAAQDCGRVIAAWGRNAEHYPGRIARTRGVLEEAQGWRPVSHLGLTKDGHPRHPLYLPLSTQPAAW